jgi:hypothetical protein
MFYQITFKKIFSSEILIYKLMETYFQKVLDQQDEVIEFCAGVKH